MGCGIHSILQKRNDNGEFELVAKDIIQFGSSVARTFNQLTESIRTEGVPTDINLPVSVDADTTAFGTSVTTHIDGHYMGEHSLGHMSLKDLQELDLQEHTRVTIEKTDDGHLIHVADEINVWDPEAIISRYIQALPLMFFELDEYRLIVGYDS